MINLFEALAPRLSQTMNVDHSALRFECQKNNFTKNSLTGIAYKERRSPDSGRHHHSNHLVCRMWSDLSTDLLSSSVSVRSLILALHSSHMQVPLITRKETKMSAASGLCNSILKEDEKTFDYIGE